MKSTLTLALATLVLLTGWSAVAQAQTSPYANTYYGELDEKITIFGVVTQERTKIADLTVVVQADGSFTVQGISGVSGEVANNGVVSFFSNGFGFSQGTIENNQLNAYGKHEQNFGTRVNEYWIVATANTPVSASFPDANQLANNWNFINWFGWFWGQAFPWIWHDQLGWLYADGSDDTFLWLAYGPLGWLGTTKQDYPFVFAPSVDAWLWYQEGTANPNRFYNTATEKWIETSNP